MVVDGGHLHGPAACIYSFGLKLHGGPTHSFIYIFFFLVLHLNAVV